MTDTKDYEVEIGRVDLFAGMSKGHLKRLSSHSQVVEYDAGHRIAAEGLGGLAFHLVLEGTAVVSQAGQQVRTLKPGDYFGEISMIDGKPRSAAVEATEPLRTLTIPYIVFQDLLDSEPSFARVLLGHLCARLRELESRG